MRRVQIRAWENQASWGRAWALFDDEFEDDGLLYGSIVPRVLLPQIGAIAVHHNDVDHWLNSCIWRLIGLKEKRGRFITQSISGFSARVELFRALAWQRYKRPATRRRITQIVQHLQFANDDRNRLIHDHVYMSEYDQEKEHLAAIGIYRVNLLTDATIEYRFDAATLQDLRRRLHDLRFVMMDLALNDPRWLSEPLPSLDKSPTLLLRKKHEEMQKQAQRQRPRSPSHPKSQPRKKR